MARKLCVKCGEAQAVRAGGLCNGCFSEQVKTNGVSTVPTTMVPIAKIHLNEGTQTRAEVRLDVVDDYAEHADALPPVVLFTLDEETYWPGSGHHRIPAWAKAGREEIPADVRMGGKREAILFGVGSNATHGLRRTNEDKRQDVKSLLADEEWRQASDNWIAERCHVSDNLVAVVRAESTSTNGSSTTSPPPVGEFAPLKRKGKDGKSRPATNAPALCERCTRVAPGKGLPDCTACAEVRKAADKKKKAAAAKKRAAKANAPRADVLDQTGAVVPDSCRDAFADQALPDLIGDLESVEAMLNAESWTTRAGNLTAHYPFILIEKVKEHAWEALHRLQLALAAIKAGVPYAVCPKCQGIDSTNNGKTCRTCRGGGHVAEARWNELQAEKA